MGRRAMASLTLPNHMEKRTHRIIPCPVLPGQAIPINAAVDGILEATLGTAQGSAL